MGDKKGQEFNFQVDYAVVNGAVTVSATSMFPEDPGDDTSIDDEGNIVLDKKDTAYINFDCVTDGWSLSGLQIKGKNDWGEALGNKAQKNYPHANAENGDVPADSQGNYILYDLNEKANSIEYRVQLKDSDGATLWSDPRVRDIGR